MTYFTFLDLFSGIGGFRIPLEELGGKCVGFSEIDKEAIATYSQNFKPTLALGDITKINILPQCDLVVGGVPCQPWSIAGKQKGFADERGQHWHKVGALLFKSKPKAFIFENVKGLTEPRNKIALQQIISLMQLVGYKVKYEVLDSASFGLQQHRERVYFVGIREDLDFDYQFPQGQESIYKGTGFTFSDTRKGSFTVHSWDLIQTTEYEKQICMTLLQNRRKKQYGDKDGNPLQLCSIKELLPNLNPNHLESLIEKKILKLLPRGYEFVNSKNSTGLNGIYKIYKQDSVFPTITATSQGIYVTTEHGQWTKHEFIEQIYKQGKYRLLNAEDCRKLQGFPDSFKFATTERIAKHQFGNAVSVPVITALSKNLVPAFALN